MLHFNSTNFLDDGDESFVSIDLNDNDECEICHQRTKEHIVWAIHSDEFLRLESSFEKSSEKLTKAHQICLDRLSEKIEKKLKYHNENAKNSKEVKERETNISSTSSNGGKSDEGSSSQELKPKKLNSNTINDISTFELKDRLTTLETSVTEMSSLLVVELQKRDKLEQEISAQKTLIEQLVKLQKNSSSLPRQPTLQTPISKTSILV